MAHERAKKVAKIISEVAKKKVGKKPTMTNVMLDADYSKSYALSGHIKQTEIWSELMEMHFPNSRLAKVHSDLLCSAKIQHYIFPHEKKKAMLKTEQVKAIVESVPGCKLIYIKNDHYAGQIAFFQAPDSKSQREALDMAYKLSGKYAPEQIELTKRKYQDLSNAELAALEKTLKDFLLKK